LVIFHFSFSIEIKERGQATLPDPETFHFECPLPTAFCPLPTAYR
jgi:hypothetical protein